MRDITGRSTAEQTKKQAQRNMKKCTMQVINVLKEESNLKIDTIKTRVNDNSENAEFSDEVIETALAKLIAGQVLTLNTDIEYRINYNALPKMKGIGVAK